MNKAMKLPVLLAALVLPAAVLAREMGIRLIDTLAIASYDAKTQGRVRLLKTPEAAAVVACT